MEVILNVEGMQCGHCKKAVEEGVSKLNGVSSVIVNLEDKTVTVMFNDSITIEEIKDEISDLGYEVI